MTDGSSEKWRTSPAFLVQLESLPCTLRSQYTQLVADYRFFALTHHRHPFVSYRVLAELIRSGWKQSDAPVSPKENRDG